MTFDLSNERLFEHAAADKELAYSLRGFTGVLRVESPDDGFDFSFDQGRLTGVARRDGQANATLSGPAEFWKKAFEPGVPRPGVESLSTAWANGITMSGDFTQVVAPYQLGLQRLYRVFVEAAAGPAPRRSPPTPPRETDTAIGRYVYVGANGVEARMYYEEAGDGPIPLLLQATAGADSRQYRHLLADPGMQKRFRMIAYDLPYHGRSMPPIGERWWETPYLPTRDWLMNWVVALADTLGLEQPYFMGCSVGGQMALDLAAEHADRFGAFISLNGWYDAPTLPVGFSNDLFRTPSISPDFGPALNFGATSPISPEAHAHEVHWIYRSSFPGIYAGDNDYFAYGHDLKENGHKIDAHSKPVYLVAGEYDVTTLDHVHGGPAAAENIPGLVYIVAPGLSHFTMSDDPDGFRDAIVPILDRVIEQASNTRHAEA